MSPVDLSGLLRPAPSSLSGLGASAPLLVCLLALPAHLLWSPGVQAAQPAVLDASMQPLAKPKPKKSDADAEQLLSLPPVQVRSSRTWSEASPDRSGPEFQRQTRDSAQGGVVVPLGLDAIGINSLAVDDLSIERLGVDALGIDTRGIDTLVDRTLHDVGSTASGIGIDANALLRNGPRP